MNEKEIIKFLRWLGDCYGMDDKKEAKRVAKEYINEKKIEALNIDIVVKSLNNKEPIDFDEWFEINGYYIGGQFWLNDSNISGLERVYLEYKKHYELNP